MSQGLFAEDDNEADEAESDDECEGTPAGPVRAVDRKTKQQRRKEKEKEEEASVCSPALESLSFYKLLVMLLLFPPPCFSL